MSQAVEIEGEIQSAEQEFLAQQTESHPRSQLKT